MVIEGQGTRPGRPVEFTPAPVIDAACRIVAADGVEALTMRRLAAESGTTITSIYRNLGDREAVLGAMLDHLAAEVIPVTLPLPPRERARTLFLHMYEVLAAMPWVLDVLRRGGQFGAAAMRYAEDFLHAADDAGLDERAGVMAYRQLWSYTLGALLTRADDEGPAGRSPEVAARLEAVAGELGLPRIRRFLDHAPGTPPAWYRDGLDGMLDAAFGPA